jgi:putative hemin transport protein
MASLLLFDPDSIMELTTPPPPPAEIRAAAAAFRAANPKARARNVADGIGVSEAELLASRLGQPGERVLRLRPDFPALLMELEALGPLMALTRNHACVHEKTGVYDGGDINEEGTMGLFLDDPIDLRLFLGAWHLGFFVEEGGAKSRPGRMAFQFFNRDGEAVHKVYAVDETDREAMQALAQRYAHDDQSDAQPVEPVEQDEETPDEEIDVEAFIEGWRALQDTHDFFPLLREHGVARHQALRLAQREAPDLARPVGTDAHRRVLEAVAESGLPIMVFVGSRGCVQIHTGPVHRLVETGPWYNVLDPGFNLHLNETAIAETYVVTKPTEDGPVTSLEVLDADGMLIVQFFGKRKPGIPELADWRALLATM